MAKHVITPAWQTQRGGVVQAAGCAAGVPVAGAKVFGETRQNLWVNPSGTNLGVTATPNEDGSLTLGGTATGYAMLYVRVYSLKPGATYTLSVDKAIPGVYTGYGFYVDTDTQPSFYVGGAALRNTFTVDADATVVTLGVYLTAGMSPAGTYRVMLNEGSEPQPWCPPGLSSVSELSIKAGASEGDPDASTAAIDLSGHQLRSLPDGTRDVLTVDGSGAVVVEENAMMVSLDGSSDEVWNYDTGGVYAYITISGRKPVAQTEENTFANLPIYATSSEFLASDTACLYISPTYLNVRSPEGFKSVQDAREWLSDNPVTAVLMRDKPAITQLDPIAPPSIPAADATLWAASDVPCDLEATTWTASGAEQGRQQAAMVALAQQVRQQAETVAALTTQALEA